MAHEPIRANRVLLLDCTQLISNMGLAAIFCISLTFFFYWDSNKMENKLMKLVITFQKEPLCKALDFDNKIDFFFHLVQICQVEKV